jgi:hypothetical protein
MSLGGYQSSFYRMKLFSKDCERRNLKNWKEKKAYAQKDKLWSKVIVWVPKQDTSPDSPDYYENPIFPPTPPKLKENS